MRHFLCDLPSRIVHHYVHFLHTHPLLVVFVVGVLSFGLSIYSLIAHSDSFSWNPEKGFEARGTSLSSRRLSWDALHATLPNTGSLLTDNSGTGRTKRQSTLEIAPKWARMFLGAVTFLPCIVYEKTIPQMEYLSQVIIKVDSFDTLFRLDTMQELCGLQMALDTALSRFSFLTPYRNLWMLPNYAACLSPLFRLNCSYIAVEDVVNLRSLVLFCGRFRGKIVDCAAGNAHFCDQLPRNCTSHLIGDLFFRILPKNVMLGDRSSKELFINTFLPVYTFDAYLSRGHRAATLDKFEHLSRTIVDYCHLCKHLQLKGLYLDVKMAQFETQMGADVRWGLLALCIVIGMIYSQCASLFYTLMVVLSLGFSVGVAFFIYSVVFGIRFFPFMNLLVIVLLVGIGADDTFVLSFIFGRSKRMQKRNNDDNGSNLTVISVDAFWGAFVDAALSMLVTSVTTAAAFYSNVLSHVLVIRCFGVFAGTTMLVNYLLVITWLPASLIIMDHYTNPLFRQIISLLCPCTISRPLSTIHQKIAFFGRTANRWCLEDGLPFVVDKGKFLWVVSLSGLMGGSVLISFYTPGLRLPERNPLQLFKNDHPYEWYDNNAELLFTFAARRHHIPLFARFVWGFLPIDDAGLFDPDDEGTLKMDGHFRMNTVIDIRSLADSVRQLRLSTLSSTADYRFWPERFLSWSHRFPCRINSTIRCCNVSHQLFNTSSDLSTCLSWASTRLFTHLDDMPVFLNDSGRMIGYTLRLGTEFRYSGLYNNLKRFFDAGEKLQQKLNWFVCDSSLTTRWFDLLDTLLHGTPMSVLTSLLVASIVVLISTHAFRVNLLALLTIYGVVLTTIASVVLLDWRVNIVESTIIILTVGLSFDFTLHYAVVYQLAPQGDRLQKVTFSFAFIGLPVLLSALTTFLAGLAMLPSQTQAFYQIGMFMMVVAASSWIFSSLFFTSLLLFFASNDLTLCSSSLSVPKS